MSLSPWVPLAMAATLAACGRAQLRVPHRDASDVVVEADDSSDSTVAPCRWTARARVPLTDAPEDHQLESVISDRNGVLVGWQVSDADPPYDHTWRLRRFAFDGSPMGDPQGPLGTPAYGIGYGPVSAAFGTARDGAIAWDENRGCRFVPITVDGAVNGANATVGSDVCASLVAFDRGFTFLSEHTTPEGSVWTLTVTDTEGQLVRSGVPLTTSARHGAYIRRVVLADGAFMLFWTDLLGSVAELHVALFATDGAPIVRDRVLAQLALRHALGRPVDLGTSVAMGWIGTDGDGVDRVHLARIDRLGNATYGGGIDAHDVFFASGLAIASTRGSVIVAWGEGDAMHASSMRAQVFDGALAPITPAFDVDRFRFGSSFNLIATPAGALAVYQAEPSAVPMQLEAVPVDCEP